MHNLTSVLVILVAPFMHTVPLSHVPPISVLTHPTPHIASSAHKDAQFESSSSQPDYDFLLLSFRLTLYGSMGKTFDELLCFLLEEIALCGNQGTF